MKRKFSILISTLLILPVALFACNKNDDASDFYFSIKMRFHKVLSEKKKYNPTTTFSKYEMISFDNDITFLIHLGRLDGETQSY